jgi:hypothetical protein
MTPNDDLFRWQVPVKRGGEPIMRHPIVSANAALKQIWLDEKPLAKSDSTEHMFHAHLAAFSWWANKP